LVSSLFTWALFLLVGETIFYFLSLGVNAIFAAFGAVMIGNVLAADGSRGRLLQISGVAEIAAIVVAIANLVFVDTTSASAVSRMNASTVIVILAAAMATWILRGSGRREARDARTAAILLVLAVLYVVGGMVLDGILSPIPA